MRITGFCPRCLLRDNLKLRINFIKIDGSDRNNPIKQENITDPNKTKNALNNNCHEVVKLNFDVSTIVEL